MKEYIVTKEILNIRSKPSDENDDTFIGQLLQGETVWLDENEISSTIPKNGTTNIWLSDNRNNVVAKDGVEDALQYWIKKYGIDELWKNTMGEGVTVIFIDSGVSEYNLSAFNSTKKSIFGDQDIEDNLWHGSLMCSIVKGNNTDILGVAPNCSIISIKITNSIKINWDDFLTGLKLIESIVDKDKVYVVNCSVSGELHNSSVQNDLQVLIDNYTSNYKMLFVSAVGNDGDYTNNLNIIPPRLKNVISIAGIDRLEIRLELSNYWDDIDCVCPGVFVSESLKQKYPLYETSGSSHACAFASGLIALFLSKGLKSSKFLNYKNIKSLIVESTNPFITPKPQKILSDRILFKENLINTFLNI